MTKSKQNFDAKRANALKAMHQARVKAADKAKKDALKALQAAIAAAESLPKVPESVVDDSVVDLEAIARNTPVDELQHSL